MSKTVHVEKPFSVQLATGMVSVGAGIQQLPDEIADHWYAKLHFANGGPGEVGYATASRASSDAQYEKAKEAYALYLALEATTLEAETGADVEPTEPSCSRLPWPDTSDVENAYLAAQDAYEKAHEEPPEEPPAPKQTHHKPASGHRSRRP